MSCLAWICKQKKTITWERDKTEIQMARMGCWTNVKCVSMFVLRNLFTLKQNTRTRWEKWRNNTRTHAKSLRIQSYQKKFTLLRTYSTTFVHTCFVWHSFIHTHVYVYSFHSIIVFTLINRRSVASTVYVRTILIESYVCVCVFDYYFFFLFGVSVSFSVTHLLASTLARSIVFINFFIAHRLE